MNRRQLLGRFAAIAAAVAVAPALKAEAAEPLRAGDFDVARLEGNDAFAIIGDVTIMGNLRVLAPDGREMLTVKAYDPEKHGYPEFANLEYTREPMPEIEAIGSPD